MNDEIEGETNLEGEGAGLYGLREVMAGTVLVISI